MSPVRPLAVPAALLALAVTAAGCTGDASSSPSGPATTLAADAGTPLEEVDTTALVVPRGPFCDRVDPAAVARALGTEPADAAAHRSGQRVRLGGGVADVVHEFGCRWGAGGRRAEAWVFAPPVTRDRADELVDLADGGAGCREVAGAAAYGDPSTATSCRGGGGTVVSYRGLFGDAWLACSLTGPGGPADELADRAGRWCAAVAEGAAGS